MTICAIRRWPACCLALTLAGLFLFAPAASAREARCHVDYGGEESVHRVRPAGEPYTVPAVPVGTLFLFRAVLETEPTALAALKVYVYADLDRGPVIVHQGEYAWPPTAQSRHGFTGRQRAYEPLRDGELAYWCEASE